jgi:hypothetical protein
VLILKELKAVCFDTLLQVLILKGFRETFFYGQVVIVRRLKGLEKRKAAPRLPQSKYDFTYR